MTRNQMGYERNDRHMRNWFLLFALTLGVALAPYVSWAADPANGRQGYDRYCVSCHGADGRGLVANAPDFSRGEGLMSPDLAIAQTLRSGKGGMPSFLGILSNTELLDVVAYLRTLQR
jgi:mono/diheme cytochrome c family protein